MITLTGTNTSTTASASASTSKAGANRVALQRVITFYETLDAAAAVMRVSTVYSDDATFKDPFNEVRGSRSDCAHFRAHVRAG